MGDELNYCMCCGENVPATSIERDGRSELNCLLCGFTLAISTTAPEARRAVPCIIAVDAVDAHRSALQGLLERSGLAEEIVALHGGPAFVSAIAHRFADGLPVDMVILDVEMPAMDGITAARFLRTLEKKLHRAPCALIFFTGRKADDNLRRQMTLFRPVWYCAKGVGVDQAAFERRATALIAHIATVLAAPA